MRAAAALHAQEPGKAEDEEDERTGRHGRGEVQIAIQFASHVERGTNTQACARPQKRIALPLSP